MRRDQALDELAKLASAGIPEMDRAHAQLAGRLLALRQSVESERFSEALTRAMALLVELRAEYAGEEALMSQHGYPLADRHRHSHADLESSFNRLARAIRDTGTRPAAGDRGQLLLLWAEATRQLVAHVARADMQLARFLSEPKTAA